MTMPRNWLYRNLCVLLYANNCHGALNVVDVGCSTGTATKPAQECLKEHGTHIKTTGIDSSSVVKSDAIKNLDHFVQVDVVSSKTDEYVGKVRCGDLRQCGKLSVQTAFGL